MRHPSRHSGASSLQAAGEPRVVLALVVQPLLAALLAAALFPLLDLTGPPLYGGRPANMVDAALAFALGVGVVATGIVAFGASPLLLWLLRRGPITRRHAWLSGLALGNVPTAMVIVSGWLRAVGTPRTVAVLDAVYGPAGAVRAVVFGSVMGVTLALMFYGICRRSLTAGPRGR